MIVLHSVFNHARDKRLWAKVEEYYKKEEEKSIKSVAKKILDLLKICKIDKIVNYIHPKIGILVTIDTDFSRNYKHFSRYEFQRYYLNDKRFLLGYLDGKEYDVYMTLKGYCETISKASKKSRFFAIVSPKDRYFPYVKGAVACDFREPKADAGWKGVLLVLKKYQNRWYLIGLAYNRWSI